MIKKLLLYSVVFLGCFFEGETALTTSAFAAHRGHLEIIIVMLIALVATLLWSWIWFSIGRKGGKRYVERKPKLKQKVRRINALLIKKPILVLLGYRFMFGLRTAVPLVIGMSSITKRKFLTFSLINSIVWDILFSSIGYYFGAFLKANLKRIEDYEFEIMGGIIIAGVITGLILRNRSLKSIARLSPSV